MTLNIAWENGDKVFLITDSLVSKKYLNEQLDITSFGTQEGNFSGDFYIKESTPKIRKLKEKGFASYAGDAKRALDAIDLIDSLINTATIEEISTYLANTFDAENDNDFELLLILREEDVNKIYYVESTDFKFKKENNFKMIGSAQNIVNFERELFYYIQNMNKNIDSIEKYFVDILSTIQCAFINHDKNFSSQGVGGYLCGVYINGQGEKNWAPDLIYKIESDENEPQIVSVLSRKESILIYSSFSSRYSIYTNEGMIDYSQGIVDGLAKTLNTSIPYAIVRFNSQLNIKQCDVINKAAFTIGIIYRQIRKSHTHSDIFFRYLNEEYEKKYINKENSVKSFFPESYIVEYEQLREKDILEIINVDNDINGKEFDFPFECTFSNLVNKESDKFYRELKQKLSHFSNMVIINGQYLEEMILEKYEAIKWVNKNKPLNFDFDIFLSQLKNISQNEFDNYHIIFLKNNPVSDIFENLLNDWTKMDNFSLYTIENERELFSHTYSLLKFFYTDEKFFHIDKLVFIGDDSNLNDALSMAPNYNRENDINENNNLVDIILGRNYNGITKMDGRFKYFPIDHNIYYSFGLTEDEVYLAEYYLEDIMSQ